MRDDDGRLRSPRRSPRARSRDAHRRALRRDAARRPRRRRHQGGAAGAGRLHAHHRAVRQRLLALLGRRGTRQALGDARSPQARRTGAAATTRAARRRRGGELPARHARVLGAGLRRALGAEPGPDPDARLRVRAGRSVPRPPGPRPQRHRHGRPHVHHGLSGSPAGAAGRHRVRLPDGRLQRLLHPERALRARPPGTRDRGAAARPVGGPLALRVDPQDHGAHAGHLRPARRRARARGQSPAQLRAARQLGDQRRQVRLHHRRRRRPLPAPLPRDGTRRPARPSRASAPWRSEPSTATRSTASSPPG